MLSSAGPITFTAKSYALWDLDLKAVLCTTHGNLAIYSTEAMAQVWVGKSSRNLKVLPIFITPADATVIN